MPPITRFLEAPLAMVPRRVRGMLAMLTAALVVTTMNVFVRQVAEDMHLFQILFLRNVFAFLIFVPILLGVEVNPLRTQRIGMHTFRAGLNTVATVIFYVGLTLIPLADVTALGLTSPLFATALAVLFLKERMGARRWVGLAVGLTGALIILRPGLQEVGTGQIAILTSNCVWAVALVCTKALARTESSLTIAAYSALLQIPIALVPAMFVWQWPTGEQWLLVVMVGGLAGLGQLLLAQAFRDADATLVLPVDFTKLVWASLAGYLVFAEIPHPWTLVGAAVVFGAVFYMAYREGRNA
jgi:drug/metabolite transporter (DMT)-like permease